MSPDLSVTYVPDRSAWLASLIAIDESARDPTPGAEHEEPSTRVVQFRGLGPGWWVYFYFFDLTEGRLT
jgi:hypothetical protein